MKVTRYIRTYVHRLPHALNMICKVKRVEIQVAANPTHLIKMHYISLIALSGSRLQLNLGFGSTLGDLKPSHCIPHTDLFFMFMID